MERKTLKENDFDVKWKNLAFNYLLSNDNIQKMLWLFIYFIKINTQITCRKKNTVKGLLFCDCCYVWKGVFSQASKQDRYWKQERKMWKCLRLLLEYTNVTQHWLVHHHVIFTRYYLSITMLYTWNSKGPLTRVGLINFLKVCQRRCPNSAVCCYYDFLKADLELVSVCCKYWHDCHLFDILVTFWSVENFLKV